MKNIFIIRNIVLQVSLFTMATSFCTRSDSKKYSPLILYVKGLSKDKKIGVAQAFGRLVEPSLQQMYFSGQIHQNLRAANSIDASELVEIKIIQFIDSYISAINQQDEKCKVLMDLCGMICSACEK